MSASDNLAPCFANSIAIPRPIPLPAPVMKICLPLTLFYEIQPIYLKKVHIPHSAKMAAKIAYQISI